MNRTQRAGALCMLVLAAAFTTSAWRVDQADVIELTEATYITSTKTLIVAATSNLRNATLNVYVSETDKHIGLLVTEGDGKYTAEIEWPQNPGNITVKSNLGGSACSEVKEKEFRNR